MFRTISISLLILAIASSSFATTYLAQGLYDDLDELKEKSIEGIIAHYQARGITVGRENIFPIGLSGFETSQSGKKKKSTERVERILLHSGCDIVAEAQGGVADWCSISFKLSPVINQSGQKVEQFGLEKVDCFQYD